MPLKPFQNKKFFRMTKLKKFAADKSISCKMMIPLFDRVENTTGKEENAGYQHFLFFSVFSKAIFIRVVESWVLW